MRKFAHLLGIIVLVVGASCEIKRDVEAKALNECLQNFGGLTLEVNERLNRYKQWSESYEEIPCFTKCYLNKVFPNMYNENSGFNRENVIAEFGLPLYNACQNLLSPVRQDTAAGDSCKLAYSGFHCLVSLENDPFVLIESIKQISSEGKTAMKDCLRKVDQYEWERLTEYQRFPVREPIPCFTKCFINKLHLFDEHARSWHMEAMQKKLGVPLESANYEHCAAFRRRRNRNNCQWMYNEFTCFAMAM